MKPFKLIVSVDKDGQSKLEFDGPGKTTITTNQVVGYLAAELEKFELVAMTEKTIKALTNKLSGIQVVKDLPTNLKGPKS